jgi:hypothetical protein
MVKITRSRVRILAGLGMAAVLAGVGAVTYQASAAEVAAPDAYGGGHQAPIPPIAESIKPPAGSRPIGVFAVERGVQIYTCAAGAPYGATSTPEAQLVGRLGRIHHFAGPSWQSTRDKSLVTASKVSSSPRDGAIAELLLKVETHTGQGILSRADFINRLVTSGGLAPAGNCEKAGSISVPYNAVYVFWDAPEATPTA